MMRVPGVEDRTYLKPQRGFVGDVVRAFGIPAEKSAGAVGLVKEVRLLSYREHSYWRISVHFFSLSDLPLNVRGRDLCVDCAPSDLELIRRGKQGSFQ